MNENDQKILDKFFNDERKYAVYNTSVDGFMRLIIDGEQADYYVVWENFNVETACWFDWLELLELLWNNKIRIPSGNNFKKLMGLDSTKDWIVVPVEAAFPISDVSKATISWDEAIGLNEYVGDYADDEV